MAQFSKEVLDYLKNSKMMRKSFDSNYGIDITVEEGKATFLFRSNWLARNGESECEDFIATVTATDDTRVEVEIVGRFIIYSNILYCPDKHHIKQIYDLIEQICRLNCVIEFSKHRLDCLD